MENVNPYLGDEVLEDGNEVDRSADADPIGVLPDLEESGNATDKELETDLAALGPTLLHYGGAAQGLPSSRHCRSDRLVINGAD
ncbi:hypothetical protein CRG98_006664 [Punica granatum]|uniref:Uncharacterized protein n=1 Tax=Punica granatum TaxID=22663 RepID=A0A2I0KWW4_PUNGR|nr:hypothetical protein CRG98_006664 [Punica granatum]